jgi:hypothetical protein
MQIKFLMPNTIIPNFPRKAKSLIIIAFFHCLLSGNKSKPIIDLNRIISERNVKIKEGKRVRKGIRT